MNPHPPKKNHISQKKNVFVQIQGERPKIKRLQRKYILLLIPCA
jgi:hypothetical protein